MEASVIYQRLMFVYETKKRYHVVWFYESSRKRKVETRRADKRFWCNASHVFSLCDTVRGYTLTLIRFMSSQPSYVSSEVLVTRHATVENINHLVSRVPRAQSSFFFAITSHFTWRLPLWIADHKSIFHIQVVFEP